MKISTEHDHDSRVCTMQVAGEIDMVSAPDVRAALESALRRGCLHVVLDLARVTYADSSALGLIVWADRQLAPKGGRLVLAGANRDVTRVLELSGLVGAAPTVSAAPSAAVAQLALSPMPEPPPVLWEQTIVLPAEPESLSSGRAGVCDLIEPLGLPETSMFDLRVAIGEALANAIRHGSQAGAGDTVSVTVTAYEDRVAIEVCDQGAGFDGEAEETADPYASSGRGVMFMRALTDDVEFRTLTDGGTAVTLVKHR